MVVIGLGDFRIFPSPVVDTDGMILPPTRVFDEVSRKLCSHPTPLSSVYSRIFSSYFAAFCPIGCCCGLCCCCCCCCLQFFCRQTTAWRGSSCDRRPVTNMKYSAVASVVAAKRRDGWPELMTMMTMTYEYLAQCHNLQLMSVFVRNFNPEFSVASSDVLDLCERWRLL